MNSGEVDILKKNSCNGDLDKIEVTKRFDISNSEIYDVKFIGKNIFFGTASAKRSVLKGSVFGDNVSVHDSIIINSFIGDLTVIENNSVVKNTTTSMLTVPVKQKNKYTKKSFFVLINNSQVDGDTIFGGTDLRKTLSRGGSIFAFAHLGGGEFTKDFIFGTQPDSDSSKKIVNIAHFGYYGKIVVIGLGVYEKTKEGAIKMHELDSDKFFTAYRAALSTVYFGKQPPKDVIYKTGRSNFGSGGSVSDYDPIKDIKSGAIFLLANTGVNVSIPAYLTVFYDSLIASGSVDITKQGNVIPENSLVFGARASGDLIEGYYDELQKGMLGENVQSELDFIIRYLKFLEVFIGVATDGVRYAKGFERQAWLDAAKRVNGTIRSVHKRWLLAYIEILENKSIPNIETKMSMEAAPFKKNKLMKKLESQKKALSNKKEILDKAHCILKNVENMLHSIENKVSIEKLEKEYGMRKEKVEVGYSAEQEHQLETSLIDFPKYVKI